MPRSSASGRSFSTARSADRSVLSQAFYPTAVARGLHAVPGTKGSPPLFASKHRPVTSPCEETKKRWSIPLCPGLLNLLFCLTSQSASPNVTRTVERLNLRFVAEPQAVRAARNTLSVFDGLIDEETRRKLRLLVSELLANAVVHGSRTQTDSIAMRVGMPAGRICVQVRDRGPGFSKQPRRRRGELRAEGWGLF